MLVESVDSVQVESVDSVQVDWAPVDSVSG